MATAQCHLWRLPGELRNQIYELLYEDDIKTEIIKIANASPPSPDLLLTCKQAHNEARCYYLQASRQYWTQNEFVVSHASANDGGELELAQKSCCASLHHRDLDQITKLNLEWLTVEGGIPLIWRYQLIPELLVSHGKHHNWSALTPHGKHHHWSATCKFIHATHNDDQVLTGAGPARFVTFASWWDEIREIEAKWCHRTCDVIQQARRRKPLPVSLLLRRFASGVKLHTVFSQATSRGISDRHRNFLRRREASLARTNIAL